MNLPTNFKAGDLVTAEDWNAVASAVNRIWNTQTDANFELVKGEPWRIRYVGPNALPEFNGPVWEIYVWRPDATHSFDTQSDPSAVYLTGPFTQFGTTAALRIAKLQDGGTRTDLDTTFATNCGFLEAPTYFRQRLARCFDNDTLLAACGAGIEFQDGGNANGLFFQFDISGNIAYPPPWSVPESLIPTITTDGTITGIASYGSTIVISLGQTNTPAGLVLFDNEGGILEEVTGSGIYIRQDGGAANSYPWVIADSSSYTYGVELEAGVPNPQGYKKLTASIGAGMIEDATWYSNAGSGSALGASEFAPVISSLESNLFSSIVEWNGFTTTSELVNVINTGSFRGTLGSAGLAGVPAMTLPNVLCASNESNTIVYVDSVAPTVLYIHQLNTATLTTVSGFNDAISDAKFFRLKNDGVTHQYIVVGDFTEFNGEAAPYMVFLDQNGHRLTDLEWP